MVISKYRVRYDITNLKRMRKLYLTFQKGATVWHQLSWSHLKLILGLNLESKRNYYINLCIKQNSGVRKLESKIKNKEYERLEYKEDIKLLDDNKELTIKDMIKNPILIPANNTTNKLNEKALKQFILDKIEEFLLELGVGFAFIGSEIKLGDYRCDLLFINYELNSFIVIELKIRKLIPQDIGQIEYYMNYIDEHMKKDYMNKTIGVILCKEDNEIVIKYVTNEKLFVSTFQLEKEINQ